jgi:hypothetical protein
MLSLMESKSLVHLYTPTFGYGWAFNKDRTKLDRIWRNIIDEDVDIVITHGPPKGILDLSLIELEIWKDVVINPFSIE